MGGAERTLFRMRQGSRYSVGVDCGGDDCGRGSGKEPNGR